ncbi:MAG: thioredoxin domain-containing protein [Candidatus Nitrosocosmicus sp.]
MKNLFTGFILFAVIFGIIIIPSLTQTSYSERKFRQGSGSMIPVIHQDDLITVDDEFSPFKDVKIGDIIVYRAPDPSEENKVIVHRVMAIIEKGNNLTGNVVLCAPIAINEVIQKKTLLTKGDANECSIPGIDFPITVENYIGTVIKVNSEYLGDSDTQTRENQDLESTNYSNPTDIQALISNLTTPVIPSATALGKLNAPINIIEFGDYQDPFSARFNQETKADLISKYLDSGIVRFGFKDLVINDLPKDKLSTLGAEASYCAADQGKYWDYHDEVYRNSRGENTGWITKESLITFAKNVNLSNISQFTNCMDSHKYTKLVGENDKFAKGLGLVSTPTFLILKDNSTRIAAIEGAQPLKVFDDVIGQMLNNTL